MITIKNKDSIRKMRAAGVLLAEMLKEVAMHLRPGVSTLEIDKWLEEQLNLKGLKSACKGYMGYRHVSCISINDEVVHGVPRADKKLAAGDLVKIDICASYQGYCADLARCFFVEGAAVSSQVKQLVQVAQSALDIGIQQAKAGNRVSDISAAIQKEVEKHGFGVVRDFAGHGIGKNMHEAPEVLNYGKAGKGPILQVGMALAIEPMITLGDHQVCVTSDGWTAKTLDASLAAHVEDTVVILDNGPYILTRDDQKELCL